ncbi:MAG: nuclear transport factor 2 family protein [Chloroflexota bacterium]
MDTNNKTDLQKIVRDGMNGILYQHSEEITRQFFREDFIQHNPFSADGLEHLLAMTQFTFVWEPARWVVDGDIVAYHGMYTSTNPLDPDNPLLCVDMWRIENSKIAEHWDVLAPKPFGQVAALLAGGGDGLIEVSETAVSQNKANAQQFMDEVIQNGHVDALGQLLSDDFVHHSESGDMPSQAVAGWLESLGGTVPHQVKRVIGSGDLVFVHSHFTHPQMTTANFDIFRFDNGKIAEHWSAGQPIAEETDNPHPHF